MLPETAEDLGAGQRTRRITTVHVGQRTTKRAETVSSAPAATVYARFATATTADLTPSTCLRTRSSSVAVVSRTGSTSASRRRSTCRVSTRESAATGTGRFLITDLSTLGTTVNGQPLPKGYVEADGVNARTAPRRRCRAAPASGLRTPCISISRSQGVTLLLWARFDPSAAARGRRVAGLGCPDGLGERRTHGTLPWRALKR